MFARLPYYNPTPKPDLARDVVPRCVAEALLALLLLERVVGVQNVEQGHGRGAADVARVAEVVRLGAVGVRVRVVVRVRVRVKVGVGVGVGVGVRVRVKG